MHLFGLLTNVTLSHQKQDKVLLSCNLNFLSPQGSDSDCGNPVVYNLPAEKNKTDCNDLFNKMSRKFAAFTLAEVLITLAVIGVVAALTIPGLITAYKRHRIATQVEKAFSTINQAIRLSETENGDIETWDKSLSKVEFIDKYFRPYIKIMQICERERSCGYKAWPWIYLNGIRDGAYGSPFNNGRVPFISMDGILYTFAFSPDKLSADNDKVIIIDINGSDMPNRFGHDVFFFYRIEEANSIIPYGADKGTAAINRSCSARGDGMFCAALIRENGWKMPKNYPLK